MSHPGFSIMRETELKAELYKQEWTHNVNDVCCLASSLSNRDNGLAEIMVHVCEERKNVTV